MRIFDKVEHDSPSPVEVIAWLAMGFLVGLVLGALCL